MRRSGWSWLLGLIACADPELKIGATFPDGTQFVAAVFYDSGDQAVGGTALVPFPESRIIDLEQTAPEAEVTRVDVHGFEEGLLTEEQRLPRDDRPVRPAQNGEPSLPIANFYAVARGPSWSATPAEGPPPLTADWLPRCPQLFSEEDRVVFDVRCAPQHCRGTAPVQAGCTFRHDLAACGVGLVELGIDGNGGLMELANSRECRGAFGPSDALLSYECKGCRVDLYSRPYDSRVTPISIDKVQLFPVTPIDRVPEAPHDGYLSDLLIEGERLVVSHRRGLRNGSSCSQVSMGSAVELIDKGNLEPIRTTTVAGCLTRLADDPAGPGFLGITRRPSGNYLLRFNDEAVVEQSERLSPEIQGIPSDLLSTTEPPRVILAVRANGARTSTVVVFDGLTFLELARVPIDTRVESLGPGPDGLVVIGDNGNFQFLDPARGVVVGAVTIGTGLGVGKKADELLFVPEAERLLAIDSGDRSGVTVTTRTEPVAAAVFYLDNVVVVAAALWQPRHDRALVSVVQRGGRHPASLALFDVLENRFLPEAFEVGTGPLSRMVTDQDGRIYGLFPWTAEVAKITPN
ncbi:MAG: hypothetical protein IPG45_22515 [Deltaproteobacteria bacterium]|nr:hypothetical protein [Deltaproteobacteria bacterium]